MPSSDQLGLANSLLLCSYLLLWLPTMLTDADYYALLYILSLAGAERKLSRADGGGPYPPHPLWEIEFTYNLKRFWVHKNLSSMI